MTEYQLKKGIRHSLAQMEKHLPGTCWHTRARNDLNRKLRQYAWKVLKYPGRFWHDVELSEKERQTILEKILSE